MLAIAHFDELISRRTTYKKAELIHLLRREARAVTLITGKLPFQAQQSGDLTGSGNINRIVN